MIWCAQEQIEQGLKEADVDDAMEEASKLMEVGYRRLQVKRRKGHNWLPHEASGLAGPLPEFFDFLKFSTLH